MKRVQMGVVYLCLTRLRINAAEGDCHSRRVIRRDANEPKGAGRFEYCATRRTTRSPDLKTNQKPPMTRIYTTTYIRRPVEVVFEFVTKPGNWPQWHPSSLGVAGSTDHSLRVGEQCTETFRVAGRRGEVVW